MSEETSFTIEQFYRNINQGRLLGARCKKCGKVHLPPRPICDCCYSREFDWSKISTTGKLLTYTIIHIAPAQFQSMTPYAMGIVELENGLKILGMIKDVALEQIKIGMNLTMGFETCPTAQPWPQWPRYYFRRL